LAEWCCACLGLPERSEHETAALALLTEVDDSIGLANLQLNLGVSAWQECRVQDALTNFRTSSDRYQRAGDVLGAALADNNVAEILTLQLHLDAAEALLLNARRVTRAASYPHGLATTVSGLSRIAAWRGEIPEALDLQLEALSGFRELQADDHVADSLVRLLEIHVLAGHTADALATADQAANEVGRLGDIAVLPATLARLTARAQLLAGRRTEARSEFHRALSLASADGFMYEIALASMGLGRLDGDDERVCAALAQLKELGVNGPPPGS
jgi:tetratricopeptide (TPR) repeat protein